MFMKISMNIMSLEVASCCYISTPCHDFYQHGSSAYLCDQNHVNLIQCRVLKCLYGDRPLKSVQLLLDNLY
jgi:hypothetical protein